MEMLMYDFASIMGKGQQIDKVRTIRDKTIEDVAE